MADPSSSAGEDDFAEENEGGESTVSMASPTLDPAMPLPISVPPPPMHGAPPNGPPIQMQMPTAPVGFMPGQGHAAVPVQGRPPPPSTPGLPTPFGGLTPQAPQGKPLPAAGAPPGPTVPGAFTGPAGMKRPQTVIGLAPPPVGAPRPGAPGGARVPLPSGRNAAPAAAPASAPRPAMNGPADKPAPSSSRGVRPPAVPAPTSTPSPAIKAKDADSTDEQLAMPEDTPDSQKEEMATMAKSAEESLALFGLSVDPAAVGINAPKPPPAKPPPPPPSTGRPHIGGRDAPQTPLAGPPASQPGPMPARHPPPPVPAPVPVPVQDISEELGEIEHTTAMAGAPPPPAPPPSAPRPGETPLPVLHDRSEEEESTRAVSREEMLRGHEAVVIGDDVESAQGEDATLAVGPGFNEANPQHLAAFAATMTKDQLSPEQQAAFPPPYGHPHQAQQQQPAPPPYPMDPSQSQPYLQQQAPQQWQDPNAQQPPPQQQWSHQPQDPNAYGQQPQQWQNGPPSYSGAIGPVSGPHMPVATNQFPQSNPHHGGHDAPHAPHMQVPQSQPHLQVPQSGQMQAFPQSQGPIPYPGQPSVHQPPPNPFGDWNVGAPQQKKFALSGQVLLLAIVGTVCLAIFITGIVLFATTKF